MNYLACAGSELELERELASSVCIYVGVCGLCIKDLWGVCLSGSSPVIQKCVCPWLPVKAITSSFLTFISQIFFYHDILQ